MNTASPKLNPYLNSRNLYRIFKYVIYALLTTNIFLFFRENFLDSIELYGSWLPPINNIIQAYSDSIDTAAWVVLLLLFELETAVISDEKLKGNLKWVMLGIRSISYSIISYAFYGYCAQYTVITNVTPFLIDDVCSLVGTGYSYVRADNYALLDYEICKAMQGQSLLQITGTQIIGTISTIDKAVYLSIVDIVNAGNWLVIVALLEVEVYLQLKSKLTDRLMNISKIVKGVLYLILFACAIYWGFEGDFLDFWDAFLWLVAFIFIELNIFQWHAETEN